MSEFTVKFIKRMTIFSALFLILSDVFMKIFITATEIENKRSVIPIYVIFIFFYAANAAFAIILATIFTRNLRLSAIMHFPENEFAFYRNFLIVYTLVPILYSIYIYNYSLPFYDSALAEAIRKISIFNYTKEYFDSLCDELKSVKIRCLKAERNSLIIGCAVEFIILFIGVRKLLKVYMSPYKPKKRRI